MGQRQSHLPLSIMPLISKPILPFTFTQSFASLHHRYRVLLVEGSLMGGYELGLETAVQSG